MANFTVRVLQTFEKAKAINHYYWMYADGDGGGQISVENLQRVVERMIRLPIHKRKVFFDGDSIRGNYERWEKEIFINIRASQPDPWIRYTITKELSHAVNDLEEEYSPLPEPTIRGLFKYAGLAVGDNDSSFLHSERLAEILATELLYPVEFREEDIPAVANGLTIQEIVARRGVPSPIIQRTHDAKHLDACKQFWSALKDVQPAPLAPL